MEGIKLEQLSEDVIEQSRNPIYMQNPKMKGKQENIQQIQESAYFKKIAGVHCSNLESLQAKLEQNSVRQRENFNESFEKTILHKLGNAYVFTVAVGYFEAEVSFLKIDIQEEWIERYPISSGAYASIFLQEFKNELYVIKSQKIQPKNVANFDKKFDRILQEYFLNQIASVLEFGPKLKKIYGFDIVCFHNCLQFSMELCYGNQSSNTQQMARYETDLLQAMKKMHSLKIVHRDIKSRNISWSPTFQKWIFLDFGLASLIKEKPGEKSLAYFRGTYEYCSKQVKSLYHLRKPGFADLFLNDFQALKMTTRKPLLQKIKIVSSKNSPLFDFLIHLAKMKNYIFQRDLISVEIFFQLNPELRNEFLRLLLRELERSELVNETERSQIFVLYSKLKEIPFSQTSTQKMQMKKMALQNDDKLQKRQQNHKYFQLFIKEQENSRSFFLFTNEMNLKQTIISSWSSFSFIKELFIFFQETLYGNSVMAWDKMKLITNILSQFLIPKYEKKSWVWKFHQLLRIFQQKFLEKKQYKHLRQVFFCYYFFNDFGGWARINQILFHSQDEKNEILNMYCQLYSNIVSSTQVDSLHSLFIQIKQKISKISEKEKPIFIVLERITSLILHFISSKNPTKKYFKEFESLFEMLNKEIFEQKTSANTILDSIQIWMSKFFLLHHPVEENLIKKKESMTYSTNKYFNLQELIQELNGLMENSSNILEPYFKVYPIFLQLPNSTSFSYYAKKRNSEKMDEIAQDLFQFNKTNLQQIIEMLDNFLIRWESPQKKIEERKIFLKYFLLSYQQNLHKKQQKVIQKYWNFYSRCLQAKDFFRNDQKLQEEVISSLGYIINFFNAKELSASNRIYVHLFDSLKKFHQRNPGSAQQFLRVMEQNELLEELNRSEGILIDFLKVFSFYEQITQIFSFQKTSLFRQILSSRKKINWCFFNSHIFFLNTISNKLRDNKQNQAMNLITNFTQHLTKWKKKKGIQTLLFKYFLRQNNETKLKTILAYLLQQESCSSVRENNYLSSFILMIYLKLEQGRSFTLSLDSLRRIYVLSVISVDKFPDFERIVLQKKLCYKFRILDEKIKSRKERILDRKEDYAQNKILLFKNICSKKIENQKKFCGKFQRIFQMKTRKLDKNVSKKCLQVNDQIAF